MRVTHAEIARRADVSRTAVSFALNGTGRLDPETRQRILRIAEELGYRPNLLVRGMQTGRTQTVGVMIRADSEFFGTMLTGVQDALAEADYVCMAVSVVPALDLLRQTPRPTAVFVPDDRLAIGVYEAATELGLAIPDDLSVVGFADLSFAALLHPPLTTLRQDPYGIGRVAAELLLKRVRGELATAKPRRVRLKPELIVRGSTAPPG